MRVAVTIAAGAALLVGAVPAHAATLTTQTQTSYCVPQPPTCYKTAVPVFIAADGEANELDVRYDGGWVFTDSAGVTAEDPCRQVSPTQAECAGTEARAYLGDGDDVAHAAGFTLQVYAGEGEDHLEGVGPSLMGGPGDDSLVGDGLSGDDGQDVLVGTDAADALWGGAGSDEIKAGGGDDLVNGDYPYRREGAEVVGTDILDGGPGTDLVTYAGHERPVTVDLSEEHSGSGDERDRLSGFEGAAGGAGADRLVGTDDADRLHGNGGSDELEGGGGADYLDGGFAEDQAEDDEDRLDGGPGDDVLNPGSDMNFLEGGSGDDVLGTANHGFRHEYSGGPGDDLLGAYNAALVRCGTGNDRVRTLSPALLWPDCEVAFERQFTARAYPHVGRSSRLVFLFTCSPDRICGGELRLKRPGAERAFAVKRYSSASGAVRVRITVPERIQRSSARPLPVEVSIINGRYRVTVVRWAFDLRRVR